MTERTDGASRRGFLALAGAGLAGTLAASAARAADAPEPTEGEKANLDLVNRFCDAWAERDADKLGEFFAEDAVFRMNENAPLAEGRDTIVARLRIFLATTKTAKFEVVRSAVMGNIVLNDRHDLFTMGNRDVDFHMSGVFFVKEGKIQEWFDYGMPKAG